MTATDALPYRPCAGIMVMNADRHLFIGQRIDSAVEAWQLPQGGIDPGEDAQTAALRELGEETGIAPGKVALLEATEREFFYDLPEALIGKVWHGKWRGQRQRWFLYQFCGTDADVNIATAHQEFCAWRWAPPADVVALAVPFKRQLYIDVMACFAAHLEG